MCVLTILKDISMCPHHNGQWEEWVKEGGTSRGVLGD